MGAEQTLVTDVLVIGCGIAGASAALEAAKTGLRVTVITTNALAEESNTLYAQGGIVSMGEGDEPELLEDDIIKAGDGLNDPRAVGVLARECKPLVERILIGELKIPFSRGPESLDFAQEGGHSRRRILHVEDTTGRTIEERFIAALKRLPNVALLPGQTAVDLLTVPHHSKNPIAYYREPRCIGAYVLDNGAGRVKKVLALTTVLAS
ncbi:MAG: FAD-dependent oxidoreductase, partial [Candidatus Aminicenantales bacterium]